jgi:hypothetical protein
MTKLKDKVNKRELKGQAILEAERRYGNNQNPDRCMRAFYEGVEWALNQLKL